MKTTYDVTEYCFKSGDTIEGVIRRMNHHDISKDIMMRLLSDYTVINGAAVPRLGQPVYIPVFSGFIGFDPTVKVIEIEIGKDGNIIKC